MQNNGDMELQTFEGSNAVGIYRYFDEVIATATSFEVGVVLDY
jgi:hypothetical protein